MAFIQFPFIEVPKDLRKIVGEPTPGTRAYRQEGTHEECGQWIEDLLLHYKGDVGISPAGVTMFVPVQRAAVHKRIKEGKLTAFFFYITRIEDTFFAQQTQSQNASPISWRVRERMQGGGGGNETSAGLYVDEPDATPMTQSNHLLQGSAAARSQKLLRKPKEHWMTSQKRTRKDKGNWKVKYEEGLDTENRQQDMPFMPSRLPRPCPARRRLSYFWKRLKTWAWRDKEAKMWKWKDEDEPRKMNLTTG